VIVKRIRSAGHQNALGEYVCGNEFYSMKFESTKFKRKQLYGIKLSFYLMQNILIDMAFIYKMLLDRNKRFLIALSK